MNIGSYYHWLLMDIFIDALIKDNDSNYKNETKLYVIQHMISGELFFTIDENDVIYEKNGGVPTEIFKNDKKNQEAIDALKILLSVEEH